jgi:tetratricopeptide (TPR) repeat protein
LYDKALEIDSTDVDALVNKAYSLIGLNQLENASLLIDKALNIQEDIYTLIAKATILIEMGQGEEALGSIDRALELDPNNAKALEMKTELSDIVE